VLEVDEGTPYLSDGLVAGLGCFLGETIRRNVTPPGVWRAPEEWGEGPVIEVRDFVLDPIGKARAFLERGPGESLSFYAGYALEQFSDEPGDREPRRSQA
jgi:hypothetical protein